MVKKIIKTLAISVLLVSIADVVFVVGMGSYQPKPKSADAIIVLGAAINSPALQNRTLEALRLYQNGLGEVIVLSGGKIQYSDISEAEGMRRVLRRNTQSMPPVLLDETSNNTYENINHAKALLKDRQSVVIVSDSYHVARGVLLAKRAGFEDVYWSSPSNDYYKKGELVYYYAREVIAMVRYIPKFIFG